MDVLVPLAEGFEEIEAVTIIDLLRRAEINTVTAALHSKTVTGSHGISISADTLLDENLKFDAIVLPGGMPGSTHLKNDPRIIRLIKKISASGGLTAAICAAPIVLAAAGVLNGKKYTCYPGYENEIGGSSINEPVVADGEVITGIGAAAAPLFALKIIEHLKGKTAADTIRNKIMAFW